MAVKYELLLSLLAGPGAVVEHLSDSDLNEIWVNSPVFDYLISAAARSSPRHIVLSGNAGDGKTSLLRRAHPSLDESDWVVIDDASALDVGSLALVIEGALGDGARLAIAINRGQLERLGSHVSQDGLGDVYKATVTFVRQVLRGLELRAEWTEKEVAALGDVVAIDLGLQDTLHDEVTKPILGLVAGVEAPDGASPETRASVEAAKAALQHPGVRARVDEVISAVRSTGAHVTMRDLWSLAAHLVTGGRPVNSDRPVSLLDAVGARLLGPQPGAATVPLAELAAEVVDPARWPHPELCRATLVGDLRQRFSRCPGLMELLDDSTETGEREERALTDGAALARLAWVHVSDAAEPAPEAPDEPFLRVVERLGHSGWKADPSLVQPLLQGLYGLLGLPCSRNELPAWRRLAYNSFDLVDAPLVAARALDTSRLKVALPRPAPAVEEALGRRWRAPFFWIGVPEHRQLRLRVYPKLLRAAVDRDRAQLELSTELEIVTHWLGRIPTAALNEVRVADSDEVLEISQHPFDVPPTTIRHREIPR